MKIIISHDVDHLYNSEHFFRDLFFPKLIVRSFIHFIQRKISFMTFIYRIQSLFENRLNRIQEIMEIDKKYGVPSVFFFGMNQGLGMSYKPNEAVEMINVVKSKGFSVGVHGIAYQEEKEIKLEHDCFRKISKKELFGIRTHYVRYDEQTFEKLSQMGYLYDTSEFDKKGLELKKPYKINNMWEFPLHIMDGYVMPVSDLEAGKRNTTELIERAERLELPYCVILYHDYFYNEKTYPDEKEWYDWLLTYLKSKDYEFVSYEEAIEELDNRG